MPNYVDLERDNILVDDGNEGKVIIRDLADIPGGRALDVSAWSEDVIKAGHVIKFTAATKAYAPLGVSDGAYASLSEGESVAGVLKTNVLSKKPFGAIMTMGEVNAAASPYPVTDAIASALPQIKFLYR